MKSLCVLVACAFLMQSMACAQRPQTSPADGAATQPVATTADVRGDEEFVAEQIIQSDEFQQLLPQIIKECEARGMTEADARAALAYACREYVYGHLDSAASAQQASYPPHPTTTSKPTTLILDREQLILETPKRCKLVVKSTPAGASVFVDKMRHGETETAVWPITGSTITVRLVKEGYEEKTITRKVEKSPPEIVESLKPVPPTPATKSPNK